MTDPIVVHKARAVGRSCPPAGLNQYGAYATYRGRKYRDEAAAMVRARIPSEAVHVQEMEYTQRSGCGDEHCPSEPAMFAAKWFA